MPAGHVDRGHMACRPRGPSSRGDWDGERRASPSELVASFCLKKVGWPNFPLDKIWKAPRSARWASVAVRSSWPHTGGEPRNQSAGPRSEIGLAGAPSRHPTTSKKGGAYIALMEQQRPLRRIPDDELLHRLAELMSQSRRVEADIVAHIAEVEERRLYARDAFPSMFAYCMDVLHLSGAEAYLRISAARASRKHPVLLDMLADGRLHLTAIDRLAPHLTHENKHELLQRATHRSRRQIEELIVEIAPRPDIPVRVRKLPERRTLPTAGFLDVPGRGDGPMLGLSPDPVPGLRPDGVTPP